MVMHVSRLPLKLKEPHATAVRTAHRAFEFGDDLQGANLRPALRDHRARRKRRAHPPCSRLSRQVRSWGVLGRNWVEIVFANPLPPAILVASKSEIRRRARCCPKTSDRIVSELNS